MLKMSTHASQERLERMVYLATEIGIGETLVTIIDRGRRTILTEHGIVLVFDSSEAILTAYLASVDRAVAMMLQSKGEKYHIPSAIINHIEKINRKHAKALDYLNKVCGYH